MRIDVVERNTKIHCLPVYTPHAEDQPFTHVTDAIAGHDGLHKTSPSAL